MVDVPIPATRPSFSGLAYQSPIFFGDRAELPPELKSKRRIALDFNAGGGRGVEIIIPQNATEAELAASEAYVNGVKDLFERFGYDNYPIRHSDFRPGIKRVGVENKSGIGNTIHTEPFFKEDMQATAIFMDPAFQAEYAALLDGTLRTLPNSVTIAPHGVGKDKGASFQHDGETHTENSLGFAILAQLNGSARELMPDTAQPRTAQRETLPETLDGELTYEREYMAQKPGQSTPSQYSENSRVLVNVPLDEPRGPGNFSDLALGEDVNLGEPSAPPEDYAPNLDDPFENTVAQMDYVVGFNDLFRLLAEPTIKIQYKS